MVADSRTPAVLPRLIVGSSGSGRRGFGFAGHLIFCRYLHGEIVLRHLADVRQVANFPRPQSRVVGNLSGSHFATLSGLPPVAARCRLPDVVPFWLSKISLSRLIYLYCEFRTEDNGSEAVFRNCSFLVGFCSIGSVPI